MPAKSGRPADEVHIDTQRSTTIAFTQSKPVDVHQEYEVGVGSAAILRCHKRKRQRLAQLCCMIRQARFIGGRYHDDARRLLGSMLQ